MDDATFQVTCTGSGWAWDKSAEARPSEVLSPTAKITAVLPSRTEVMVMNERLGRANGVARPMVSGRGRGSGSGPSSRFAA